MKEFYVAAICENDAVVQIGLVSPESMGSKSFVSLAMRELGIDMDVPKDLLQDQYNPLIKCLRFVFDFLGKA
jgi:hypothetical protein